MPYAIRNDNLGWRVITDESEIVTGEYFSLTLSQEIIDATKAIIVELEQIQNDARDRAANISGWSTWDETQAQAWFTNNLDTPLENARTQANGLPAGSLKTSMLIILDILDTIALILFSMGRMLIALRDKNWQ